MGKKLLLPAAIVAILVLAVIQLQRLAVDTSLANWLDGAEGFRQAEVLQQSTGKPIAVFFHTDWCESCKKLTANVLGQDPINQYLKDFISVKINPERSAAERQLGERFSVTGFPSFFILKDSRRTAARLPIGGNTSQTEFVQTCNTALRS